MSSIGKVKARVLCFFAFAAAPAWSMRCRAEIAEYLKRVEGLVATAQARDGARWVAYRNGPLVDGFPTVERRTTDSPYRLPDGSRPQLLRNPRIDAGMPAGVRKTAHATIATIVSAGGGIVHIPVDEIVDLFRAEQSVRASGDRAAAAKQFLDQLSPEARRRVNQLASRGLVERGDPVRLLENATDAVGRQYYSLGTLFGQIDAMAQHADLNPGEKDSLVSDLRSLAGKSLAVEKSYESPTDPNARAKKMDAARRKNSTNSLAEYVYLSIAPPLELAEIAQLRNAGRAHAQNFALTDIANLLSTNLPSGPARARVFDLVEQVTGTRDPSGLESARMRLIEQYPSLIEFALKLRGGRSRADSAAILADMRRVLDDQLVVYGHGLEGRDVALLQSLGFSLERFNSYLRADRVRILYMAHIADRLEARMDTAHEHSGTLGEPAPDHVVQRAAAEHPGAMVGPLLRPDELGAFLEQLYLGSARHEIDQFFALYSPGKKPSDAFYDQLTKQLLAFGQAYPASGLELMPRDQLLAQHLRSDDGAPRRYVRQSPGGDWSAQKKPPPEKTQRLTNKLIEQHIWETATAKQAPGFSPDADLSARVQYAEEFDPADVAQLYLYKAGDITYPELNNRTLRLLNLLGKRTPADHPSADLAVEAFEEQYPLSTLGFSISGILSGKRGVEQRLEVERGAREKYGDHVAIVPRSVEVAKDRGTPTSRTYASREPVAADVSAVEAFANHVMGETANKTAGRVDATLDLGILSPEFAGQTVAVSLLPDSQTFAFFGAPAERLPVYHIHVRANDLATLNAAYAALNRYFVQNFGHFREQDTYHDMYVEGRAFAPSVEGRYRLSDPTSATGYVHSSQQGFISGAAYHPSEMPERTRNLYFRNDQTSAEFPGFVGIFGPCDHANLAFPDANDRAVENGPLPGWHDHFRDFLTAMAHSGALRGVTVSPPGP